MTLNALCNKYKSDKGNSFTEESHNFANFYEEDFARIKKQCEMENRKPKILEIGVFDGASLKSYEEYFDYNVDIYGIDILDKSEYDNDNIHTHICDQGNLDALIEYVVGLNTVFDIIIEDGSHKWSHQTNNLLILHMLVRKRTGIYILEDLHTSYSKIYNDYEGDNVMYSPLFFLNFFPLFADTFKEEDVLTPYYKSFCSSVNNITIKSNAGAEHHDVKRNHITSIISFV